jgi:hypothetical protein
MDTGSVIQVSCVSAGSCQIDNGQQILCNSAPDCGNNGKKTCEPAPGLPAGYKVCHSSD